MKNLKTLLLSLSLLAATTANAGSAIGEKLSQKIEKQRLDLLLSLVESHSKDVVCYTDAYTPNIVRSAFEMNHLWSSPKTGKIRAEIQKTKNLKLNLALKLISTEDPANLNQFKKAMLGTRIFGPARGVFGNTTMVDFLSESEILVWELDTDLDNPRWNKVKGTWTMKENGEVFELVLTTSESSEKLSIEKGTIYYNLHHSGDLRFKTVPEQEWEDFTTSPSECEA